MFRITCMVDDKHLANALRVLATSNAYDVQSVPVVNATKGKNGVEAETNGTAGEMFIASLKSSKKATFMRPALKQFMGDNGYSVNSTTYVLKKLIDDGLVKKTASKGVYGVKP